MNWEWDGRVRRWSTNQQPPALKQTWVWCGFIGGAPNASTAGDLKQEPTPLDAATDSDASIARNLALERPCFQLGR